MFACTIIAGCELAHARVLAQSLRAHGPSRLAVLVLDDRDRTVDGGREPFELLGPEVAGASLQDLAVLCERPTDLAQALRPWLMRHLVEAGWPHAVWLAPTVAVYGALDPLIRAVESSAIALVPRHVSPPRSRATPRGPGPYDSGLMAVSSGETGRGFLDWWARGVQNACVADGLAGRPPGDRLLDLVPGAFPGTAIVRDAGLARAHWNLESPSNELEGAPESAAGGGAHLRAFNFSGFDPHRPHWLTSEASEVRLSADGALARMCGSYAEALIGAGYDHAARRRYGFERLASGLPLDRELRTMYARARASGEELGDVFTAAGTSAFVRWLNGPADGLAGNGVTRYMERIWARRPDLQSAFPTIAEEDGPPLVAWMHRDGRAQEPALAAVLPPADHLSPDAGEPLETAAEDGRRLPGVNLVGYLGAGLGLGEAARLYLEALTAVGISVRTESVQQDPLEKLNAGSSATPVRKRARFGASTRAFDHPTSLVCVNPPELVDAHRQGYELPRDRLRVGVWAWEVDSVPDSWLDACELVDEVWVYSRHVAAMLAPVIPVPVVVVPLPVVASAEDTRTPELDMLPASGRSGRFTFLFMFDAFSTIERKNPLGAIEAFKRAFPQDDEACLIVKSFNGDYRPEVLERIRFAARDRPDIEVVDAYLSREQTNALVESCDCYLSLHRSEGFGLTLAEAMIRGKPVIATGYSGNTDFMTPANSYLVDYSLAEVAEGTEIYPAGATWAEPDLDRAAELMRRVLEHRDEARMRGERARAEIREWLSPERIGALARARLELLEDRSSAGKRPCARRGARPSSEPDAHEADGRSTGGLAEYERRAARGFEGPRGRHPRHPRELARRAALRAIRPFTTQQSELNRALGEVLGELLGRVEDLGGRLDDLGARVERSERVSRRLTARVIDIESRLAGDADPGGEDPGR